MTTTTAPVPVKTPRPPRPSRVRLTRLELAIAWRYLRSRRGSRLLSLISIIAIGGVVVGVSALILIMGVMNGLQRDLRDKILVGSPDIRVMTYGDNLMMDNWRPTLDRVRRFSGITAAAPVVLTQGLVRKEGALFTTGAQVVGIDPAGPGVPDVTEIRRHAILGDFRFSSSDKQHRGVVLGKKLSEQLNAWPGERIVVVTSAGGALNPVTGMPTPVFEQFEVTGIFETGMYEYDNTYMYVALDKAQRLAGLGQSVTAIEARTTDRWQATHTATALQDSLGFPYLVRDWQEQNASLFSALKLEKLGMSFILLLIVIVAAFNIVSTLTMVVTDKTREIGILKAMGLPARSVRRIFFLQGLVIGVAGTGAGVLLGLGASVALGTYKFIKLDPAVYFIDHLPVATQASDVLLTVAASVLIAAVATLYPATQAARLYPIEAIRHE
ncbi:MacB-like periplasmic core domain protein [Gemmatirosa kalamazoonensis]|uniref:MacB-like periplasmic core domain protein n=1 Tax=Gemmatirosa kalamazoonensis TaxID=861299 RepID=W0RKA9_9BACT|nr:ABC transporter permease [Gemmatirosa kalamazoonensis]AHG90750.1 MacB-like periplasmic core domain protein [Gemmatirosa kalamazoonensis]